MTYNNLNIEVGDVIKVMTDKDCYITDDQSSYNTPVRLQVISRRKTASVCYVPTYINVTNKKKLNAGLRQQLELEKKWLNSYIVVIADSDIIEIIKQDSGATCSNCKLFCRYAEPNQPDNTFICYQCKESPYRCKF